MQKRSLGPSMQVSAMGYGCMGLTGMYGTPPDRQKGVEIIRAAVEMGVTLLDSAEAYGPFTNEKLLGEALAPFRDQVTIATKFGWGIHPDGSRYGLDSRPQHIREVVNAMLERLRTDRIDLLTTSSLPLAQILRGSSPGLPGSSPRITASSPRRSITMTSIPAPHSCARCSTTMGKAWHPSRSSIANSQRPSADAFRWNGTLMRCSAAAESSSPSHGRGIA